MTGSAVDRLELALTLQELSGMLSGLNPNASADEQVRALARRFPPLLAKARTQLGMDPVMGECEYGCYSLPGYFETRLRDGSVGYFQRRLDDCLTAGLASLVQIKPHLVPDLQFEAKTAAGMDPELIEREADELLLQWQDKAGLFLEVHPIPPTDARRWLGVVCPPGNGNEHCLVMRGREVLFDPARLLPAGEDEPASKYTVEDIDYGITIESKGRWT